MPGKEGCHQESISNSFQSFFHLVHHAYCGLFHRNLLKPDAALLVEDDEADCGNVVGGRVGWAGLLGANLDFLMFFCYCINLKDQMVRAARGKPVFFMFFYYFINLKKSDGLGCSGQTCFFYVFLLLNKLKKSDGPGCSGQTWVF